MKAIHFFMLLAFSTPVFAGRYDFLNRREGKASQWTPEISGRQAVRAASLNASMGAFYGDFEKDSLVSFYVGYGKDAYTGYRSEEIYNMLRDLATHHGLPLGDWSFDERKERIEFKDLKRGMRYLVQVGYERNEYAGAFAQYDVVMYHGHSRYGRGPAFEEYSNYFRMGDNFKTIEVDTRNPYFADEPMQLVSQYPVQAIELDGKTYPFQYRGQKTESSYLYSDSYTKNIPGLDKDLKGTQYLPGRQFFYFYSCENIRYWKAPLRRKFATNEKMVFGTHMTGWWGTKPDAVFIMSVVRRVGQSSTIVSELNATGDCGKCFIAY